jgi:hypothetical protein
MSWRELGRELRLKWRWAPLGALIGSSGMMLLGDWIASLRR